MKHPDTVGADRRGRILGNLRNLERFVLGKSKGDVQIRCYRPWASLRGRRLGSTLDPLVTGDLRTAEGKQLHELGPRPAC